jgi:hypothetical protein
MEATDEDGGQMSGYDPKCGELALYFLGKAEAPVVAELAQWIQDNVEDWLAFRVQELERRLATPEAAE